MLTLYGLSIIAFAWLIQFLMAHGKKTRLSSAFLGSYAVGTACLVADGYLNGQTMANYLNLVSGLLAIAVLLRTHGKK